MAAEHWHIVTRNLRSCTEPRNGLHRSLTAACVAASAAAGTAAGDRTDNQPSPAYPQLCASVARRWPILRRRPAGRPASPACQPAADRLANASLACRPAARRPASPACRPAAGCPASPACLPAAGRPAVSALLCSRRRCLVWPAVAPPRWRCFFGEPAVVLGKASSGCSGGSDSTDRHECSAPSPRPGSVLARRLRFNKAPAEGSATDHCARCRHWPLRFWLCFPAVPGRGSTGNLKPVPCYRKSPLRGPCDRRCHSASALPACPRHWNCPIPEKEPVAQGQALAVWDQSLLVTDSEP